MKAKAVDLIGLAGFLLLFAGFYLWRPCFALIYVGAVALWVARTLSSETPADPGRKG